MANLTVNETLIPSLDELLDKLGFEMWQTIVNTFILPPINLIGIAMCSFSLWIFSRSSFEDSIFFYYKLLCFVNIIHLSHNIPFGILFSSSYYFPQIDTFATNVFNVYCTSISFFLFHYEDVLQMGILLHKMKHFSPFVKKYFTLRPQSISFIFFLTCLLIGLPVPFSFKIYLIGICFYSDSNGVRQTFPFYYYASSDFSQTFFGKILLGFSILFADLFLSLLFGIILNIHSYIKYKSYSRKKQREVEQLQMSSANNRPTTSKKIEQQQKRERTEHHIERNMFYMALTLCSISIISRLIFMFSYVCFITKFLFSNTLLKTIVNTIFTIMPTMSTFVFYSFNKMFRDETKKFMFQSPYI